jgi:spore coat polysaccharide biosynthesis protein SpsF
MVERVKAARTDFESVVATTWLPEDAPIRALCAEVGIKCYSGHPTDLLARHYQAGVLAKADVVAKIPSDCPLIDPEVIDLVFDFFERHLEEYDYVSNLHPATFPDGNDVEIMPMGILREAWLRAMTPFEREHTTPFIWRQPGRYRIGNVEWKTGPDYSTSHRWTIDYPEDYTFISAIYDRLWSPSRPIFSMNDILELLSQDSGLGGINAMHVGKAWYNGASDQTRSPVPAEQIPELP